MTWPHGGNDQVFVELEKNGHFGDPIGNFAILQYRDDLYKTQFQSFEAFLQDRRGCVIGKTLADRYRWKVGDTFFLESFIPPYRRREGAFEFTVRGIYRAGTNAVDNQSMLFHWKYADERSLVKGQVGWYVVQVAD